MASFNQLDPGTLALILRLQAEDVAALERESMHQPSSATDVATSSLNALQAELRSDRNMLYDRLVATRLGLALGDDDDTALQDGQEERIDENRLIDQNLGSDERVVGFVPPSAHDPGNNPVDNSSLEISNNPETRPCLICEEEMVLANTYTLPCGHVYCIACVDSLFAHTSIDETLWPPRCCQQRIPLEDITNLLQPTTRQIFEIKSLEWDTKDRTYCHMPQCSTFIPPSHIVRDKATCPACQSVTCTICKNASHTYDCPQDPQLQQVLALAEQEGWQRCNNCQRVVELGIGCNHMTCRCGHQFCYVCGTKWKECDCHVWDEHNLIERAEDLAEFVDPDEDVDEAHRVEHAVQFVRQNHECNHEQWRRDGNGGRCEGCDDELQGYLFECFRCGHRVCRRCRHNRL